MTLCDNISPLRFSMTRVEKYRRYRQEISNMKFETFSEKLEIAEEVDKVRNAGSDNKLKYDDVIAVNEAFDKGDVKFKKRRLINLTKYEIFYYLIAFGIIAILIIGMIMTGTILWRK